MRIRWIASACLLFSMSLIARADSIIYNVNISYSNVSAKGTVTTDGTLGALNNSNITDYSITIRDGAVSSVIDSISGQFYIYGPGITATTNAFLFDFSSYSILIAQNFSNGGYLCVQGPGMGCDYSGMISATQGDVSIQNPNPTDFGTAVFLNGTYDLNGLTAVAETPEPSSLALLGTGLLGVVGAARRRIA